jgi:HEAT repeat protein
VANALMSWSTSSPEAVRALALLARSKTDSGGFGTLAANALLNLHTKEAVPVLVQLLDSEVPSRQEQGVRGLSLFVRGAPVLTPEARRAMGYLLEGEQSEFRDAAIAPYLSITPVPTEQLPEHVAAWKAWWTRMSGKLSSAIQSQ